MEQSWNPVNNYIYGAAVNSVYGQLKKEDNLKKLERVSNTNTGNSRDRERDKVKINDDFSNSKTRNRLSHRKLLGEFFNNETPRM